MSVEEDIREIEEEIRKTPYHKATQGHIGKLKAKLAKLRTQSETKSQKSVSGGFSVKKTGDATVLIVGFPSVGKSTLLNQLTNADSKIGSYDFTTLDVVPGMMDYNGAKIQLLDIPGMITGASEGKGLGKQILSAVRSADLVLIVADKPGQVGVIRKEMHNAGFRLDDRPPDIKVLKTDTGGLRISLGIKKPKLSGEEIKSVLNEFKVHNAEVVIRENVTADQLIDHLMGNRVYVPSVVVLNKADAMEDSDLKRAVKGFVPVSALKGDGMEDLREKVWEKLGLIRLHMKRIGKAPDMEEPLIMEKGCTVMDVAGKILRGQEKHLRYARIWGPSAKFPEQKVGPEHKLKDMDVVELHA